MRDTKSDFHADKNRSKFYWLVTTVDLSVHCKVPSLSSDEIKRYRTPGSKEHVWLENKTGVLER